MENTKENSLVLAVDLGGTKIAVALVSRDGNILAMQRTPTLADEGQKAVIERIFRAIDGFLDASKTTLSQLAGIGFSAPGPIDMETGTVTESPNLPGWQNVPLRDIVQDKYKIPTSLIHDATAAALAEHRLGAGKGVRDLVYITVSTGIGGGIIIDGKLYTGAKGTAGEIGHMTIDANGPRCSCGNTGCLEVLASGTAMAREARKRLEAGEVSLLSQLAGGNPENITAETIALAAERGDRLAGEVILQAATYLGIGMANLVNILNPEMIIVGGGVANMGDRLLKPAIEVVRERAFKLPARTVRIVRAGLSGNAELLGAAMFALESRTV